MSKSINKCTFIGNLGSDPEVRYTGNGTAVTNVSIACTEKWNENEHTEWVRLTFWKRLAEVVGEYCKKGDRIYVEGQLRTRDYEHQDGGKRYVTEIRVGELVMLGEKRESAAKPAGKEAAAQDDDFDSLPF